MLDTAEASEDYIIPVTTLTFYEGNSSIQCINITIVDDLELESSENFCITALIVGVVDSPFLPKAFVFIEDDDGMYLCVCWQNLKDH